MRKVNYFFPEGFSLLLMASIGRHGSAKHTEMARAIKEAVAFEAPPEMMFSAVDTLVRRGWVERTRGRGGARTDTFRLTEPGRKRLDKMVMGLNILCPPDPVNGERGAA